MRKLLLTLLLLCGPALASEVDICQAVSQGQIKVQATGDGKSCRKVQLLLRNAGKQPLSLVVPRFTVLDHATLQDVLLLEAKHITLPPGGEARSTCQAMCCGERQQAPPSPVPSPYQPVPCSQHPGAQQACAYFESSSRLCRENAFAQLPIAPSQIPAVIAQLAFWKGQGALDKAQFRELAQRDLNPTKPEEKKEFDQGIDNVWEAVDLTVKGGAK